MTSSSAATETSSSFDEEWEEWDGSSPFWVHCVAGSLAGVAEHTLVYPLDTVRTHIQVCAACNYNGANAVGNSAAKSAALAAMNESVAATGSSSTSTAAAVTRTMASSSKSAATTAPIGSVLQKAAASSTITMTAQSNNHNLTMIQAIRQLMSQPLALESRATGTVGASSTRTLKSAAESAATTTTEAAAVVNTVGISRLWRGVQTILIGCIPAHALYFSSYEMVKAATLDKNGNVTTYGSALAGGAAVISHDLILGPLDTVKQRLQLGHYRGLPHALSTMIRNEGAISLFRSFPITLASNIPYGMVMVGTNEFCKQQWSEDSGKLTMGVTLGASALAGLVAAATTTPLDRIKTYLQTQQLSPACMLNATPNISPETCPLQAAAAANGTASSQPIVANWRQAALRIYQTEGTVGFFRGLTPRILSHTPAVAISWTTYETAKRYLLTHYGNEG